MATARRDLLLAWKRPGDVLNPLFFFAMVCTLFPLAVGPSAEQLQFSGPGVLWVAALLSTLLSLNSLFLSDYEDGSLDQLLVSPQPLPVLVLGKTLAHWLTSGVPLVIVSPVARRSRTRCLMAVDRRHDAHPAAWHHQPESARLDRCGIDGRIAPGHGSAEPAYPAAGDADHDPRCECRVARGQQRRLYTTGIWALGAYAIASLSLAPLRNGCRITNQ